uniref:L1 transposable element RRM domain-containing protein n=1 Tax=Latimeria chalumnae TaxID=7897 RepID=H3ADN0_LATCH
MLWDIKQSNSHIEEKLIKMDQKMETFTKRIDEVERWGGDAEDSIQNVDTSIQDLQTKVVWLQEKADDLENCSHQCNLRLVGLPEGEKGKDPVAFLEDWLPSFLNLPDQENKIEIERAHQTFAPRSSDANKPCMILFKLLRFRDKELLLRQAQSLGSLTYKNKPSYLFPDMGAKLFEKRKSFNGVKRLCKYLDIPFALLYPSRLRVDFQGKHLFFSSLLDAKNHLKMASYLESSLPPQE